MTTRRGTGTAGRFLRCSLKGTILGSISAGSRPNPGAPAKPLVVMDGSAVPCSKNSGALASPRETHHGLVSRLTEGPFAGGYITIKWQGTAYPDVVNNVEIIRIRPSDLTGNTLNVEIVPTLNGRAVPGLDGTSFNQDFALYVYNAQCVSCP